MRFLKLISLCFNFYKNYALASFLITAALLFLFWEYGFSIFMEIIWGKIFSLLIIAYFIDGSRKKEYYFYYNAGISKKLIWYPLLAADIAAFLALILISNKFR